MRQMPVFISCPTSLNSEQEQKRSVIIKILHELQLEPRALGRSDYPKDYPLKEIFVIAKHCSGGIIMGFEQMQIKDGVSKRGTAKETLIKNISLPTSWNNLEAGILFGMKLPLLIFKEETVEGGVFDNGVSDNFVHIMPSAKLSRPKLVELKQVVLKWFEKVSEKYHQY